MLDVIVPELFSLAALGHNPIKNRVNIQHEMLDRMVNQPQRTEDFNQGPVVRKPIDANPGLKLNRGLNFFL